MSKYPTFSIITITLNNFSGLQNTCKSVEKQSLNDYEWIIIDGASTDETIDFLRQKRTDTRANQYPTTFISKADQGIYDAMNIGIGKAKGNYLLFLNAGDELASKDTLEMITKHTKDKPDFIYGDSLEPQTPPKEPFYKTATSHKDINWGMFTHHQAMIYNRLKVRDNKMHYSLRYKIASDYDFTARFLKKCSRIIYIEKPICIFEQGGISQTQASLGRKEQYIIRENLEMLSQPRNLWILITQSVSWKLKKLSPALHDSLKSLMP